MRTQLKNTAEVGRNILTAVFVPEGAQPKLPAAAPDKALWNSDFGKESGKAVLLRGARGLRWFVVRVAKKATPNDLRDAAGRARIQAESMERSVLSFDLSGLKNDAGLARAVADGAGMAGTGPGLLKTDSKKLFVKRISLGGCGSARATQRAVKAGAMGALGNLAAREVANLPSNYLTPKEFARKARAICRPNPKLQCKVMGRKQMEAMKMGSLLGVARGSAKEPQLVHMTYKPKGKSKGKIAVIGKGLIFDSGGISLKPSGGMWDMKFDMCGAGAVYGLFAALAKGADCPYEVHGIMACVENMPGSNAQNPGDIVTAMNGKTIEVLNTDAEGRLVLEVDPAQVREGRDAEAQHVGPVPEGVPVQEARAPAAVGGVRARLLEARLPEGGEGLADPAAHPAVAAERLESWLGRGVNAAGRPRGEAGLRSNPMGGASRTLLLRDHACSTDRVRGLAGRGALATPMCCR